MPRRTDAVVEDSITNSPLRRSSRITATISSPAAVVRTRRLSEPPEEIHSSERNELKSNSRGKRGTSVTKEIDERAELGKTRSRRNSTTSDNPNEEEKKQPVTRSRRASLTSENSNSEMIDTPRKLRTRRGSTQDDKIEETPVIPIQRRRSVSEEKENTVTKKSTRGRRKSIDVENLDEAVEQPPKERVTRSRRSSVGEVEPEEKVIAKPTRRLSITEKEPVKSELDLSIINESEENEDAATRRSISPGKAGVSNKVETISPKLNPATKKESIAENKQASPQSVSNISPNSKLVIALENVIQTDKNVSKVSTPIVVVEDHKLKEDNNIVKTENSLQSTDTNAPKPRRFLRKSRIIKEESTSSSVNKGEEKSVSLNNDNEKMALTSIEDKSKSNTNELSPIIIATINSATEKSVSSHNGNEKMVPASIENESKNTTNELSPTSIATTKSTTPLLISDEVSIQTPPTKPVFIVIEKSSETNNDILTRVDSTNDDHLDVQTISPVRRSPRISRMSNSRADSVSPSKLNFEEKSTENTKADISSNTEQVEGEDSIFVENEGSHGNQQIPKTTEIISDGSDGSFNFHLNCSVTKTNSQSTEEQLEETDFNVSIQSNSSDKENIPVNEELKVESIKNLNTNSVVKIDRDVGRVSNVFRPKNVDYSFIEPMDVDQTMLNITTKTVDPDLTNELCTTAFQEEEEHDSSMNDSFKLSLSLTHIQKDDLELTKINDKTIGGVLESPKKVEVKIKHDSTEESNNTIIESPATDMEKKKMSCDNEMTGLQDNSVTCVPKDDLDLTKTNDKMIGEMLKSPKMEEVKIKYDSVEETNNVIVEYPETNVEKNEVSSFNEITESKLETNENDSAINVTDISTIDTKSEVLNNLENDNTTAIMEDTKQLTLNKMAKIKSDFKDINEVEKEDSAINTDSKFLSDISGDSKSDIQNGISSSETTSTVEIIDEKVLSSEFELMADNNSQNVNHIEPDVSHVEKNFGDSNNLNDSIKMTDYENKNVNEVINDTHENNGQVNNVDEKENIANTSDTSTDVKQHNESIPQDNGTAESSVMDTETSTIIDANQTETCDENVSTRNIQEDLENDESLEATSVINQQDDTELIVTQVTKVDEEIPENPNKPLNINDTIHHNVRYSLDDNDKIEEIISTNSRRKSKKDKDVVDITSENNENENTEEISFEDKEQSKNEFRSKKKRKKSINKKQADNSMELTKELIVNVSDCKEITSNQSPNENIPKKELLTKAKVKKQKKPEPIPKEDNSIIVLEDDEVQDNHSENEIKKSNSRGGVDQENEQKNGTDNSELDNYLYRKLSQTEESEDEASLTEEMKDDEESNEFIVSMAEEGEEDTPSEDSNQIIDEGESINTTESERETDDEYEDDSFICDDEADELLPGDEYDLDEYTEKTKKSRIINVEDIDSDVIKIIKKEKSPLVKKKSRIIHCPDSSDEDQNKEISDTPEVLSEDINESKLEYSSVEENLIVSEKKHNKSLPKRRQSTVTRDSLSEHDQIKNTFVDESAGFSDFVKSDNKNVCVKSNKSHDEISTRRSSINIQENIKVSDIKESPLRDRINHLLDSFCSQMPKGDISMKLALEYQGKSSESNLSDDVFKEAKLKKKLRNKRGRKLNKSQEGDSRDNLFKRRKTSSSEDNIQDERQQKRRVKRKLNKLESSSSQEIPQKKRKKHKKSKGASIKDSHLNKLEDLKTETMSIMNQLITDVKNRPRRTVKPSTSRTSLNSNWVVEDMPNIKPSTSFVTKQEVERFKFAKFHPKDFRNQMLYDPSRVKRIDTKKLLAKRDAYL